ncbi:S41 family peptidase [Catellatospora sp. NEAU-YM18]|nr:S41 family peptidase [Catellatospora tritici]
MTDVITRLRALVEQHYVFPEAAADISARLAAAADGYPIDPAALAAAVTADLQAVNGDRHLRLVHSPEPLPERADGDDAAEWASMRAWAERTANGVATVRRLPGDVGLLELNPLLFPAAIVGDAYAAAMTLLAPTRALVIDLRGCLGGDPNAVSLLASYLWDDEPVEFTGHYERRTDRVRQSWTHAHVPGRRYGRTKPVYALTSATTFSGGEALAYGLQALGRAVVVGERTRGGAHPREAFRVHDHLEATISVARSVSPVTGGNWEGTGVSPDVATSAADAFATAYRAALEQVAAHDDASGAEARQVLADALPEDATPLPV